MFSKKSKVVIRDGKLIAKNTNTRQLLSILADVQVTIVLRSAKRKDYVGAMNEIKAALDRRLEMELEDCDD